MAASNSSTATLLNPSDSAPSVPVVHILPPSSTTTTPSPVPVLVPSMSPTPDPCGDSVLQPAIFSPTAASVPGMAQPVTSVSCGGRTVEVKDLRSLLEELSLPSEEALFAFVQEGFQSALQSVQRSLQGQTHEDVRKTLTLLWEMWAAGRLSSVVRCHLGSLVAALREQRLGEARDLQLSLKAYHSSEVSEWIEGLRPLLQGSDTQRPTAVTSRQGDQVQCHARTSETCVAVHNSVPSDSSAFERLTDSSQLVTQAGTNVHSPAEGR